jgi:L-asparaginase
VKISESKDLQILVLLTLIALVAVILHPGETSAGPLPKVKILATGGTIAGVASSPTETKDYKPGTLDIASIMRSVPGLEKLADISGEQVANVNSSHMTDGLMLNLSRRINELLATGAVDGIVVTHGTDTLEETAYFLNLTVKSDKPVVVTGSMRPSTAISADGPLNLYNAVVLAADKRSRGRGVLVTLNETVHSARYVTKTNTTSVDTFRSADLGCLGYVLDATPYFYQSVTKRHTVSSEFADVPFTYLPRVDIIYGHANGSRTLVDAAVAAGSQGIIIAGAGDGGIFPKEKEALVDAVKKGVVVVRASRTGSGIVTQNREYDSYGFATSNNLNPQKARILLMLSLAKTTPPKEIQRMFDEY